MRQNYHHSKAFVFLLITSAIFLLACSYLHNEIFVLV